MNNSSKRNWFYHPFFAPVFIIIMGIIPLANWLLLNRDTAVWITFIWDDYITPPLYVLAMIVLYICKPRDNTPKQNFNFWIFEFITLGMLLRELGIQHWLTQTDTTAIKIRFFLNPGNPIHEKIITGLFLLMWLVIAIHLFRRYTRFLFREFFRLNATVWTIGTTCMLTVIVKFVDRLADNYKRYTGMAVSDFWDTGISSFEEIYEAFLPILIMIAAIQFARHRIRLEDSQPGKKT